MENYTYNPLSGEWDKVGTVYNGDIINNPDNEDITVDDNNQLKLADRTAVSGKGYKILRRIENWTSQFDEANTIYEVRYDFDLNGGTLTIPESCVLNFQGGSLSNGTIDFNQAMIEADDRTQIFKNLNNFYGIRKVSACWFGIKGDVTTDNTKIFQWLCNTWHYKDTENAYWHEDKFEIHIPSGIYRISGCINEGVYSDYRRYARYCLIGEGESVASTLPMVSVSGVPRSGLCERTVLYCVGNYTEKPFIYAPKLLNRISIFGEYIYNDGADYANQYVCKNTGTIAVNISAAPDVSTGNPTWASSRRIEDVQISYFGTGLLEGVSYSCNMKNLRIDRCVNGFVYESNEGPEWSNTIQIMESITIEYCREHGLYINTPNFHSFLNFYNLTCQFNDIDNIGTDNSKHQIEINSGRGICIDNLYVEQWGAVKPNSNVLCKFNADFMIIRHANIYEGTYIFEGRCNDISHIRSIAPTLVFSERKETSIIRDSPLYKITGGENLIMLNCIDANGSAVPFGGSYVVGDTYPVSSLSNVKIMYKNKKNAPLYYDRSNNSIWGKVRDGLKSSEIYEFEIPTKLGQIRTSDDGTEGALTLSTDGVLYSGGGGNTYKKDAFGRAFRGLYGNTRPSGLNDTTDVGYLFFDQSLAKPVWWTGTAWVDATGTTV